MKDAGKSGSIYFGGHERVSGLMLSIDETEAMILLERHIRLTSQEYVQVKSDFQAQYRHKITPLEEPLKKVPGYLYREIFVLPECNHAHYHIQE